jgi:hypothetical protein
MDNNYHKKYLKYREKYLLLKNQTGGRFEHFSNEHIVRFFNSLSFDDLNDFAKDENLKSRLKDQLLIDVLHKITFTPDEKKICDLFISYTAEHEEMRNIDAFIKFYSFKDILLMIGDIESQKQRLLSIINVYFRNDIKIELIKYLFMAYSSNNQHLHLHKYTKEQLTTLYRSIIDRIENALPHFNFRQKNIYLLTLLKFLEKSQVPYEQASFVDRILRFNERQYRQLVEYMINRQNRNAINFIEYDLPDEDLERVYAHFKNESRVNDSAIRDFIRILHRPTCPICHNEPCTCQKELGDMPLNILDNIIFGLDLRGLINFAKTNPQYEAFITKSLSRILRQIKKTEEERIIIDNFLAIQDQQLKNIRFLSILEYALSVRNIEPEYIPRFFQVIINSPLKKETSRLIATLLDVYYNDVTLDIILERSQQINPVLFNSIVAKLRARDDSYAKGEHDHAFAFINECVIRRNIVNDDQLQLIAHLVDYYLLDTDEDSDDEDDYTSLTSLYKLMDSITPAIARHLLNLFSDPKMHGISPDKIRTFLELSVNNGFAEIYYAKMAEHFINGNMTDIIDLFFYTRTLNNRQLNNDRYIGIIIDSIFENFKGKPYDKEAVKDALDRILKMIMDYKMKKRLNNGN